MTDKIIAICLFLCVITFVVLNTIVLEKKIVETSDDVSSIVIEENGINVTKDKAERLFEEFKKKESYISLTVSHDDLTNIENSFVDLIGYLSVEDVENAKVAKSRLIHSLEHLRRLSGINIDAII